MRFKVRSAAASRAPRYGVTQCMISRDNGYMLSEKWCSRSTHGRTLDRPASSIEGDRGRCMTGPVIPQTCSNLEASNFKRPPLFEIGL